MAYAGTTSTAPNPPVLVTQGIAAQSSNVTGSTVPRGVPRTWTYVSTHFSSDIAVANFFTDGQKLGMLPGDHVIHTSFGSTAYEISDHAVVAVGSTTTKVTDGLIVSSAS